jgi:cob(I)alamin adenosyltransferase
LSPHVVHWLNRLADLLFVMARVANARAGVPDRAWSPRAKS